MADEPNTTGPKPGDEPEKNLDGGADGTSGADTTGQGGSSPFGEYRSDSAYGDSSTSSPYGDSASSPYGDSSAPSYGSGSTSSPYGDSSAPSYGSGSTSSPYGDSSASSPYGDTSNASSPYGDTSNASSPYGDTSNASSPYGDSSTSSPYGDTSNASSPYGDSSASSPYGDANAASPYADGNAAASPTGDTSSTTPYGGADAASPYADGNAAASPYGETSSSTPYGAADAASPYGDGNAAASPYGGDQNAATPYGASGAVSPYGDAKPAEGGYPQAAGAAYGAPGQQPGQQPAYGAAPPYGGGVNPYGGAGIQSTGRFNIFGLLSLILGGVTLVGFSWIPVLNWGAAFFAVIALVLGILGLTLKNFNARKGLAIAGSIVSLVALIVSVTLGVVYANTIFSAGSLTSGLDDYDAVTQEVEVVLTVTSDGSPVDIDYTIDNGIDGANAYDKSEALFGEASPWTSTHTVGLNDAYDYSNFDLNVDASDYDKTVSCEITVNGTVVAQDESQGFAYCSVYGVVSYL